MSEWKAKRFWKTSGVVCKDGQFHVELDGRAVKTPAKRLLALPTQEFADKVCEEWDAQEEFINPRTMPFTKTANAALDKVAEQHSEVADMLAAYGDSDLLCYRADAPEELIARQSLLWDPLLDWAADHFGARLQPRTGIMHQAQDAEALRRLSRRVHSLNFFELAAFHDLVSLSGSLILGFACAENEHSSEEIWNISRVDEDWQSEQWGRDDEAEALAEIKKSAFIHAKQSFDMSRNK